MCKEGRGLKQKYWTKNDIMARYEEGSASEEEDVRVTDLGPESV